MKVVDFDGVLLDATFSVQPPAGGVVSVVIESSGGHEGGPNPRNLQYRQGINVLLRRLRHMSAVIEEIRVETGRTRQLPPERQRIVIPDRSFPVALSSLEDVDVFRQEISRYGRKVGQPSELAANGGGSSRRLRIFLTNVPMDQAALERQLVGQGVEAESDAVAAVVEIAAEESRGVAEGDEEGIEGRTLFRLHRLKERDPRLVRRKKRAIMNAAGRLLCEVCDFDFAEAYGPLGEGFAECHHRVPLSQLEGEAQTRLADLAIVCANCHRMLHRQTSQTVEHLRVTVQNRRAAGAKIDLKNGSIRLGF